MRGNMKNNVGWNDRFKIGVETIDKAHQKLFAIVCRLINLNEDEEKSQWACMEGVKYFKSYTMKHFAEEEAYMRYIDYSGYAMHKKLHDDLRDRKLPALERELELSDYSAESVRHFIGICIGWLTEHIMIEDRAITGKIATKWVYNPADEELETVKKAVSHVMQEIFRFDMRLISEHYSGEDFGSSLCYRVNYISLDGKKRMQLFFILEERLILSTVSGLLGTSFKRIDNTVLSTVKQLFQIVIKRMGISYKPESQYRLEKDNFLTDEQIAKIFERECPPFSLLYNTGNGYFAFCVKK